MKTVHHAVFVFNLGHLGNAIFLRSHLTTLSRSHCPTLCHPDRSEAEGRDLQFLSIRSESSLENSSRQPGPALDPKPMHCSYLEETVCQAD